MKKILTSLVFISAFSLSALGSQTLINAILSADVNTSLGRKVILDSRLEKNDSFVAAVFNKKIKALKLELIHSSHIGDIKPSMLTESEYQANFGTSWVLAKGQNVAGSQYSIITGRNSLPDLRGVFPRGKNNGATTNPAGDLALGTYQADEIKSHQHYYYVPQLNATGGPSMDYAYSTGFIWGRWTDASGGAESRPRNITVNYFIKIN